MKDSKVYYMKNKVEHWQVVSIGLVVYDTIAVTLAFFLALWFRFDCRYTMIPSEYLSAYYKFLLIYVVFSIFVFWRMRLYNSIWRFASYSELLRTIVATGITFVFHCIGITVLFGRMPLSYYVFGIMIQFALTLGVRFSYRFVLLERSRQRKSEEIAKAKRVLLIGAGKAGQMILRDIKTAKELKDIVCCIIDDNPNKWGRYVEGVPVIGGRDDILSAVERFKIEKIVLAVPSASAQEKRDILNICKETGCELKNLPGIYQFLTGEVRVSALKDVAVEDLLGRDPIRVNMEEIYSFIQGKKVLVTGGGGSIGSGLCRQIASHHPKQLIILDIYENNVYDIQQELKKNYPELDLVVLIGSVRDSRRINTVFESYRPDVVYHAAMMNGCQRFVLISTDKAVNPTNIMGASKRLCEMIVQSFDRMVKEKTPEKLPILYAHADDEDGAMVKKQILSGDIHTEFVAVRFGNVLGSNGSVIPLFKKQIAAGGPVTVTHPDIIRYFMTIPEAVSLVLQAGTYAKGGEIFVLDMGSPVKIDTLARNLIKLSGLKPDVDIQVEYTGLRPGEKLYEEKLMAEEGLKKTPNSLIHVGCPIPFETEVFLEQMQSLMEAAYTNDEHIREKVAEIVTTYHPAGKNGSEEKGEVYERLLDQSAEAQELRQQKRNQILSEGQ